MRSSANGWKGGDQCRTVRCMLSKTVRKETRAVSATWFRFASGDPVFCATANTSTQNRLAWLGVPPPPPPSSRSSVACTAATRPGMPSGSHHACERTSVTPPTWSMSPGYLERGEVGS